MEVSHFKPKDAIKLVKTKIHSLQAMLDDYTLKPNTNNGKEHIFVVVAHQHPNLDGSESALNQQLKNSIS